VSLLEDHGELVLSIRDDGRGFDRAATPLGGGLQNMADRLAALGGTLTVRSRSGAGTTIEGRRPFGPILYGVGFLMREFTT
jgi:signal transduction histidine kinase